MKTRDVAAVVLMVCAVACSRESSDEKLIQSLEPASGWVPTLRMTATKWLDNSVPPTFVGSTAKAAQKEFERARKTIRESNASRDLRDRADADLTDASAFAKTLERAVEQDQRAGMAGEMTSLTRLERDLEALEEQYGGDS